MKKILTIWILLAPVIFDSCTSKPKKQEEAIKPMQEVSELPGLILIGEDGKQFSASKLPGKTILIFFGADCDHCQREATQIQTHLQAFQTYTLYFISLDPFPVINKFAETYKINNLPNILFVRADGRSVFDAMGPMKTPTICIYGDNKKLVKRFNGETKIEEILKEL